MLHGAAGCVFVVLFQGAECEHVSRLLRFACVSVLPGCSGCGCVSLSPTLGCLCVQWKAGATEKRLQLHRMCFVLFLCRLKVELCVFLFSCFNFYMSTLLPTETQRAWGTDHHLRLLWCCLKYLKPELEQTTYIYLKICCVLMFHWVQYFAFFLLLIKKSRWEMSLLDRASPPSWS